MTTKKHKKESNIRKSSKPRSATPKSAPKVPPSTFSGWADPEEEGDYRHGFLDAAMGISRR